MEVRACAKINLTLEVMGPRDDGYHELATILQTIDLWDTLKLEPWPHLELTCTSPGLEGPENLVWKAATRLQEVAGEGQGARIRLEKGIPEAMGMGGGSSDATTTLMALDELWDLNLGQEELRSIAAELGSDAPFFLQGGTALAQGRGEVITPLPSPPPQPVVLLCPPCQLPAKTARLYGMLCPDHYSDGSLTRRAIEALEKGQLTPDLHYNTFEQVAPFAFDGLEEARDAFLRAGAEKVHLCGSGPGLFSFVHDQYEGERVLKLLQDTGWKAYLVSTT